MKIINLLSTKSKMSSWQFERFWSNINSIDEGDSSHWNLIRLEHALRLSEIFKFAHNQGRCIGKKGIKDAKVDTNFQIDLRVDSAKKKVNIGTDLDVLGRQLSKIIEGSMIKRRLQPEFREYLSNPKDRYITPSAYEWEREFRRLLPVVRKHYQLSAFPFKRKNLPKGWEGNRTKLIFYSLAVFSSLMAIVLICWSHFSTNEINDREVKFATIDRKSLEKQPDYEERLPTKEGGVEVTSRFPERESLQKEKTDMKETHGKDDSSDVKDPMDPLDKKQKPSKEPYTDKEIKEKKEKDANLEPDDEGFEQQEKDLLKAAWKFIPSQKKAVIQLFRGGRINSISLISVGPGSFQRKCDKPKGRKTINVENFLLGEAEVTQMQYAIVMGIERISDSFEKISNNLPVSVVSWDDSSEFCMRMKEVLGEQVKEVRLPWEYEWEFASQAPPSIDTINIEEYGWVGKDSQKFSHPFPIKQKRPNDIGVYDLWGNVEEWVNDYFTQHPCIYESHVYTHNSGSRVVRGGSFLTSISKIYPNWRIAKPSNDIAIFRGFRIVVVPKEDNGN